MADGYFNQCKACKKIYATMYTEKNIDVLIREYKTFNEYKLKIIALTNGFENK